MQVGNQSIADRFTYVPQIGLLMLTAWGVTDLVGSWRWRTPVLRAAAVTIILACALATWKQVGYWRDSFTLFGRVLEVMPDNYEAHLNLGLAYAKRGQVEQALPHFQEAARLKPRYAKAQYSLGVALQTLGRLEEAIPPYRAALQGRLPSEDARHVIATAMLQHGINLAGRDQLAEAEQQLREAVEVLPDFANARYNLGVALARQGKLAEALREFEEATRLDLSLAIAVEARDDLRRQLSR